LNVMLDLRHSKA